MKNTNILKKNSAYRLFLIFTLLAFLNLIGCWLIPERFGRLIVLQAQAATFVVTNTTNGGTGSLRQAILDANNNSDLDTVTFNIPPSDPRHFYYQNNGVTGTVSQSMIAVSTAADDTTISDIDPDWAHSWYSISTEGIRLDINTAVTINGFTQTGAQPNTNSNGGLNTVLRIEVTGNSPTFACNSIFNTLTAPHTIKGLIINRCQGIGISFDVGNIGSVAAGNFIGTDASGTVALGNDFGIRVERSSNVSIGSSSAGDRNLISGNYRGIVITSGSASGNAVSDVSVIGNLVGTERDGINPLGNGFSPQQPTFPESGIKIESIAGTAINNIVENNVIAFNSLFGIALEGGGVGTTQTVSGNRIINNSIYSNGSIGIELKGGQTANPVTENDMCDTDTGMNNLQNFPVLASAVASGGNVNISGMLDSSAGGTYTIHFYSSPTCDPSGHGEGKTPLGSITVVDSDNNCLMDFNASLARPTSDETFITATATDITGNTSEFSTCVKIANPPFDFDGDLKTDISIFRPTAAEWWYQRSSNGQVSAFQFGTTSDKITVGDWTGDGKADISFWRPSTGFWFILRSEDSSFFSFPFGANGDIPMPADYDGDGKTDAAVFRPSSATWFINRSGDGGSTITQFGTNGDFPVAADYDGDGKADIAIWRDSGTNGAEWWILRSTAGISAIQFGSATDKPVPGDFTGDGKADIAFFRPNNGNWFILRSEDSSFFSFPFGANGDISAPGDYDGDGKFDPAVFRPSNATWFIQGSTSGIVIQQFGATGDFPIPSAFIP